MRPYTLDGIAPMRRLHRITPVRKLYRIATVQRPYRIAPVRKPPACYPANKVRCRQHKQHPKAADHDPAICLKLGIADLMIPVPGIQRHHHAQNDQHRGKQIFDHFPDQLRIFHLCFVLFAQFMAQLSFLRFFFLYCISFFFACALRPQIIHPLLLSRMICRQAHRHPAMLSAAPLRSPAQ